MGYIVYCLHSLVVKEISQNPFIGTKFYKLNNTKLNKCLYSSISIFLSTVLPYFFLVLFLYKIFQNKILDFFGTPEL